VFFSERWSDVAISPLGLGLEAPRKQKQSFDLEKNIVYRYIIISNYLPYATLDSSRNNYSQET